MAVLKALANIWLGTVLAFSCTYIIIAQWSIKNWPLISFHSPAIPKFQLSQFPTNTGIYLFEVSTKKSGLDLFHHCALESAALQNPDSEVFLLLSDAIDKFSYAPFLKAIPNFRAVKINLSDLVESIPMLRGFSSKLEAKSFQMAVKVSDLTRFAFLYIKGGLYTDLDVIHARPTSNAANWIVMDPSPNPVNNAIMKFNKGNPYLRTLLEALSRRKNGTEFGTWGIVLASETCAKYCQLKNPNSTYQRVYECPPWMNVAHISSAASLATHFMDLILPRIKKSGLGTLPFTYFHLNAWPDRNYNDPTAILAKTGLIEILDKMCPRTSDLIRSHA